jgi:hypothetical protein
MAGTILLVVNPYDLAGIDTSTRSTIVEGLIVPSAVGAVPIQITAWSITANVLTLTANNSLTVGGGQSISVSGFQGTAIFLDGTYTTTSATATTIVVPLVHANASGVGGGFAVLSATYVTGGLPISYAFVNQHGLSSPIGTIGPRLLPKWIEVQSISGTAAYYKVNSVLTPNTLVIYAGVTETTSGAVPVTDVAQFRAEFLKNGY